MKSVTRIAIVDRDLCTKEECGYRCIKVCPVNRMAQECVVKEKDSEFPVISELLCIGCALCVKKCPVNAIKIINLAAELDKPLFQYGVNAFRLYGLPLPKSTSATSIIGKNGIGKTTAIRLLSGQLKPNLGRFEVSGELFEELPIEIKRYFAETREKLRISSKPQNIDKIREVFKGTARELLKTVTNDIKPVAERFAISEILDRKVVHLSGGELQKLAIAVAWAKDADLYYFDEVTNYLDIEERLRVGILVKELAEKKSVLVAEHDLVILDYVSDYIYIIYGTENAYGIVSQIKSTRAGINEYLGGYLKEENVRFREHEIEFATHSQSETKASIAFKYGPLKKSFEGFSFSSEGGEVRKGEVIGLVGKNAMGKSLFVKMLAGVEKPDEGEHLQISVSYKPQYITPEEKTVTDVISARKLNTEVLEECKRKLALTPLMDKLLTEISGGELQRVAITLALSSEADAYLFDEPTAFLDIEQRFEFAALLRKIIAEKEKTAFVVDHDLVFIDAVASRLIVFDGKPSVSGHASYPYSKRDGMNVFLKGVGITLRRDKDSKRPRINKPGSVLDREQKEKGEYYYSF
ncbi:MAG: ribosome biogenesis/translation initiation ATPase RLI [Candidatus Bilamarchaeaceae archaeon]